MAGGKLMLHHGSLENQRIGEDSDNQEPHENQEISKQSNVWFQTQIKLKWFLIKSNKQISIKEVVSKGWFLSHDLKNFRTPPS